MLRHFRNGSEVRGLRQGTEDERSASADESAQRNDAWAGTGIEFKESTRRNFHRSGISHADPWNLAALASLRTKTDCWKFEAEKSRPGEMCIRDRDGRSAPDADC